MLWNVEGAVAEPHRIVALQQQPLFCKEPERAKRDRASVHRRKPRIDYPPFTQFYLTEADPDLLADIWGRRHRSALAVIAVMPEPTTARPLCAT